MFDDDDYYDDVTHTHNHYHSSSGGGNKKVSINKTVKEERAPTDESIRLLDEFQEKAEDRIIKSFNIQNNDISAGILVLAPQGADYDSLYKLTVHYRYKLNNNTYQGKGQIDKSVYRGDQMEVVRLLFDDMSKVIADGLFEANREVLRGLFM